MLSRSCSATSRAHPANGVRQHIRVNCRVVLISAEVRGAGARDATPCQLDSPAPVVDPLARTVAPLSRPKSCQNTFDPITGTVPEQDISVTHVMDQARSLEMRLFLVPLPSPCGGDAYADVIDSALRQLCEVSARSGEGRAEAG